MLLAAILIYYLPPKAYSQSPICEQTSFSCINCSTTDNNQAPPATVTTCYAQIPGCLTFNNKIESSSCTTLVCDKPKCLTCSSQLCEKCDTTNYVLLNQYCYRKIEGCAEGQQQNNSCKQCIPPLILVNNNSMCVNSIANCRLYDSKDLCGTCADGYHTQDKKQCYQNVAKCQDHNNGICITCVAGHSLYSNTVNKTSLCFANIENCSDTLYKPLVQKTYCSSCTAGFELTEDERCRRTIRNCALYTANLVRCLKCDSGYYLTSDTQCSGCTTPILYCLQCSTSSLFGRQCQQCVSGFQLGPNQQSCIANCQLSDNLQFCISCANQKCQTCANGYYINESGLCSACNTKFANCDTCAINQCTSCSAGYYYDSGNKYCYKCSTAIVGCEICSDKSTCQKCQNQGYILQSNKCITCGSQIQNCQSCIQRQQDVSCLNCLTGFVQASELGKVYCLSCITHFMLPFCLECQTVPSLCKACVDGYYLNPESLCMPCPQHCTKCKDPSTCLSCVRDKILQANSLCSSDISSFQLTGTTGSDSALAYGNIIIGQKGLGSNPFMGALNQRGFFCQSDKGCNMNGRCLLTKCVCITDMVGSRCQFSTTDDFSSFHSNIISYLSSVSTYDQNTIDLLTLVADTSYSITDSNIQRLITLLQQMVSQKFYPEYYTIIGSLLSNLQPKETIASQKLLNFDALNLIVTNKQSSGLLISEISNTSGPFHKQQLGKFDLKDPDSLSRFRAAYVKAASQCDNDRKFLSPEIYFSDALVTKLIELQGSASTPLTLNQMHLYYNPFRSSGQSINSTISRIEFIKNNEKLNISEITATIIVPKTDQLFSDVNEQNECVTWNNDKGIWEGSGTTVQRCRFYTVCQVSHFSDFGTFIKVNTTRVTLKPTLASYLDTDFRISLAVQNCAFALSCTLIGLFLVFTIMLCLMKKYGKKRIKTRMNTYDGVMQSGLHLEPALDTERAQNIKPISRVTKTKNFWTVYPPNSIMNSDSLDYQMQKMSLWILQMQMYIVFTSIYLAVRPFSFGRLTAWYILAVVQTWVTNYIFGGLALAFRRKSKKSVYGCYWVLYFIIFMGMMIIGIWRMYGLEFKFDMYLLVGVGIEFVLDAVFCDLFVTYFYQSLFIDDAFGFWKIIKYRGYFE